MNPEELSNHYDPYFKLIKNSYESENTYSIIQQGSKSNLYLLICVQLPSSSMKHFLRFFQKEKMFRMFNRNALKLIACFLFSARPNLQKQHFTSKITSPTKTITPPSPSPPKVQPKQIQFKTKTIEKKKKKKKKNSKKKKLEKHLMKKKLKASSFQQIVIKKKKKKKKN